MDKREGLTGHMVVGLNQDTCLIGMKQLEMVGYWIHLTGGVMTMGSILVLFQRDIIHCHHPYRRNEK